MKKVLSLILVLAFVLTTMAACSGTEQPSTSQDTDTSASTAEATTEEAKPVVWWYYHKGEEALAFEAAIEAFNASQTEYVVEGFSVPDKQKYIVAMSGGESPDLIGLSNQDVVTYQSNGLLEPLQPFADAAGFDFNSIYGESAMLANSVDGEMYGMPFASVVIQMFYNKDILESIGETEPPTTMEELYDMAVRATTTDANGDIDILGYPLFPLASARQELIYAFGGTWVEAEDGVTVTPDSQGVIDSLTMNVAYRSLYGIDQVQKFVATGNTNRYTPQDIFFAGKQLFRFDGPWLAKQINDNSPEVNYGVALIPGTEANPELLGVSRFETTSVAIPVGAQEKDGAYALAQWLATDGAKDLILGIGSLPSNKNLYDDPDLLASNDSFPSFMEALKADNGIQYPRLADSAKYTSLIETALDYVYNGSKTPEEAMADLKNEASTLQ